MPAQIVILFNVARKHWTDDVFKTIIHPIYHSRVVLSGIQKKESTWVFKVDKGAEAGMTEDRGKCIRLFARIVKKSVKSRLNQEKIVRFIARTVFQSIKTAVADSQAA